MLHLCPCVQRMQRMQACLVHMCVMQRTALAMAPLHECLHAWAVLTMQHGRRALRCVSATCCPWHQISGLHLDPD